jgi:leucyl/phenylalanyl-tRNA--protein transferase
MVYRLSKDIVGFPDPHLANKSGLFAVGGDLTPEWLLLAYSHGIFPWFDYREDEILWHCPQDRFVIFPKDIHISHSMRTLMNQEKYHVTFNKAFDQVIEHCSKAQGRDQEEGAWLGGRMLPAYKKLREMNFAMSVEVWQDTELVGGLYGVTLGNSFFGESMCSLVPSASKLALIHLAQVMQEKGGKLIDCQFETPHLKTMGGRYIPYDEYLKIIRG